MNRELKFRAWTGEDMVFVHTLDIYPDSKNCRVNTVVRSHYEKWPIMQYTGMNDKNDKPIYECDFVQLVEAKRHYTVEFMESTFKLIHADPKMNRMHWGSISRVNELIFTIEVIGNVYENPELVNRAV